MGPRVLIVDDHPFVHEQLRAIVAKAIPGATVHAEMDLAAAIAVARGLKRLDLVLLDLGLPGCSGLDALLRFRKSVPGARVAIFSAEDDPASMRAALEAGAAGYIPKTTPPRAIVHAVRLIAEGERYVPAQAAGAPTVPPLLTPRQAEVLRLVARGLHNREIGSELGISEETVKQHVHAVFEKLGVSSRTEAVAAAARLGLKAA